MPGISFRFLFLTAIVLISALAAHTQEKCAGETIFTADNCQGDAVSNEESALLDAVNSYRASQGLAPVKISASLSKLGNRRMLDLQLNVKTISHSWSNCRYEVSDEKTWPCLTDSPRRLRSGYTGQGYETLFRAMGRRATAAAALEAWKKSSLHNSIILNRGMFAAMPWEEMGVAIEGEFAALWFGHRMVAGSASPGGASGLGISLEKAIAGLSQTLKIEEVASAAGLRVWTGTSVDKKMKLEISGKTEDIGEAAISLMVRPEKPGTLSPAQRSSFTVLLKNIFPGWADSAAWLDAVIAAMAASSTGRTKILAGKTAEVSKLDSGGIRLTIKPQPAIRSIEMD